MDQVERTREGAAAAAVEAVRAHYDALGAAEHDRLVKDVRGRVALEVHRRFLARFVRPGMRVLEIGAATGRFTIELAALGATVKVTDLSPVQLGLNERFVAEAGAESAVEAREVLDLRDAPSRFPPGSFDAVVAFGGPLSYLFEDEETALRGLTGLVAPGGAVVCSVMSQWGAWRTSLPGIVDVDFAHGPQVTADVLATGDLRHVPGHPHVCRMFTWAQVEALVVASGGRLLAGSASNWASLGDAAALARLEADPERWARFLDHETAACAAPGARDGGTHILFATAREERPGALV